MEGTTISFVKKEVDLNTSTVEYFEESKPILKVEAGELSEIKTEGESPLKAIKLEPTSVPSGTNGFLFERDVWRPKTESSSHGKMKSEEYFEAEDTKLSLEINQREKENPTPTRKREYLDARLTTPFIRPLSEMKYKCVLCPLKFSDLLALDLHRRQVCTGVPPQRGGLNICNHCKSSHRTHQELKRHKEVCPVKEAEEKDNFPAVIVPGTPGPRRQCNICFKWEKNEVKVLRHIISYHCKVNMDPPALRQERPRPQVYYC